ncbi:MAG: CBASS cGAMP synthase, partial [Thiohalomonadales bacterium]
GALEQLAKSQKGWRFSKDKDTCARIILPNQAHIDVPLYAIPDERHEHMTAALKAEKRQLSDLIYGVDVIVTKKYLLETDEVFLATRKNGWKKSDPLLISNWFKQELAIKGERLRRVCRFLKAWRDYIWEDGGPSSLALMVCASEAYPSDDHGLDGYALLTVAKELPRLLGGEVCNPAAREKEVIYPRGDINCDQVADFARALVDYLESAMRGASDKSQANQKLIDQFGIRMPRNEDWIEIKNSAALLRATPAIVVKPEYIPNSKSG